ncbi:MAG: response regulator [Spirochaetes bacterium]|nr:response regulator [Spirochaetota bacterium]
MELIGKILIVDDEKMTLDFFDITLSKLGFEVIKAVSGEEALDKIKLYSPDLILLDNILPSISGIEVTQKIRNDKKYKNIKDIPIIMFSAIGEPNEKVLSFEVGVDDYITKPFNFSEVLARIRSVFRHKKLAEQILLREKKLAVLESLNNNLIAFTKHIKKPLTELNDVANGIDINDKYQIQKFMKKFEIDYNEMLALLNSLEDEIMELQKNGDKCKEEDLFLYNLEDRISKYIKAENKL